MYTPMVYASATSTTNYVSPASDLPETPTNDKLLNVCLVEDNETYRESIEHLIKSVPTLYHAGSFPNCEALLRKNATFKEDRYPDVILLDITFQRTGKRERLSGIEGLEAIRKKLPRVPIVMLTDHDEASYIFNALQRGASGYLHKSSGVQEIIDAIYMADRGGMVIPPVIAAKMRVLFQGVDVTSEKALTKREMEIVELMAKGLSRKDIAEALYISPNTVDSHLNKIYQKLHVSTGTEAIAKIYGAKSPIDS